MIIKEFLDSDRVNFLIWRYLLEGNYRETAAKFQKEWHIRNPHREFDFARHVQGHALVSVVNSGLVYYALEREHARRQMSEDQAAEAESLRTGIFGPLTAQPAAKLEEVEDEDGEGDVDAQGEDVEMDPLRKRSQVVQLPNGSPTKRPRLSNGYDNKSDAATVADAMDVDQQEHIESHLQQSNHHQIEDNQSHSQDNHAYPSPLEGEQVPPPIIRTDGPEQGTQVEKVQELSTDTTFIHLTTNEPCATETTPSSSPAGAENAPILLQCEWNPRDASVLAAAGTDALARLWKISCPTTAMDAGQDHVQAESFSLVDADTPRTTTATALAWNSDGTSIALATDLGTKAIVTVWDANGAHLLTMEVPEPPVVKLCWNPSGTALLSISPKKGGASITIFSIESGNSVTHSLPGHDIAVTPVDASWTSDSDVLICGGDMLECLHYDEKTIERSGKFETKEDDSFTQVIFDARSNLAATSTDKGTLDLWDENRQRRSISAHQGAITAMAWQPVLPDQQIPDDERLIATGGDDCAILIWNARRPESKAKCFMTMDSPIVRLAFTPDGAFIAGATSGQVLIWKVGNPSVPRASWSRPPHPGWLSPKGSESEEEDEHTLCWDKDGKKLAYGSNSRLALISFKS